MLFLYKRPGQRVIVNAAGRMMVRPTHMEASVQRATGGILHPNCVYTTSMLCLHPFHAGSQQVANGCWRTL